MPRGSNFSPKLEDIPVKLGRGWRSCNTVWSQTAGDAP